MIEKGWQLIEEYLGWEIFLDPPGKVYYAIDPYQNRYGPILNRADLKLFIRRSTYGDDSGGDVHSRN